MKYIKLFENNAAYQAYADSAEYIEPHVSLAEQENELHYNKPPFSGKWLATYQDGHTTSAECDATSAITLNEINLTNLVSVELGDCVTELKYQVFKGCTTLTAATLNEGLRSIEMHNFRKTGLLSVTIPSTVNYISYSAFADCSNLTSVTVLATTPPYTDDDVFTGTPCTIFVPAESVDAFKSAWSSYSNRIQPIA